MDHVAVEDLQRPDEHFRCERYHAVMPARVCLARQAIAVRQLHQDLRKPTGDRISGDYDRCRGCPVGPAIAARLSRPAPAKESET